MRKHLAETGLSYKKIMVFIAVIFLLFSLSAEDSLNGKISVYVVGMENENILRDIRDGIMEWLYKSDRFDMVLAPREDLYQQIMKRIHEYQSANVDISEVARVGHEAGENYVCIVTYILDDNWISLNAKIIEVETRAIRGIASSKIKDRYFSEKINYETGKLVEKLVKTKLGVKKNMTSNEAMSLAKDLSDKSHWETFSGAMVLPALLPVATMWMIEGIPSEDDDEKDKARQKDAHIGCGVTTGAILIVSASLFIAGAVHKKQAAKLYELAMADSKPVAFVFPTFLPNGGGINLTVNF